MWRSHLFSIESKSVVEISVNILDEFFLLSHEVYFPFSFGYLIQTIAIFYSFSFEYINPNENFFFSFSFRYINPDENEIMKKNKKNFCIFFPYPCKFVAAVHYYQYGPHCNSNIMRVDIYHSTMME